jgi:outer membrane protein assembly factor BamB
MSATKSKKKWATRLNGVDFAILPPSTTRPNPVVVGDKVFAVIFSPGAVCGFAKRTGRLLWRTPLNAYGGTSVIAADGTLFAKSCRTLYALNPQTGEIRWEFTPHSEPREWIYSEPAVGKRSVFIGDRSGDLHCLDQLTGKTVWRRGVSRGSNNQVNATALIAGPGVITANNAGAVVCYAVRTGKTLWRRDVGGPCSRGLLRLGSNVVIGAGSLFGLDVNTGSIRFEVGFPQKNVSAFTVAQKRIVTVFGPDFGVAEQDGSWGYELVVIERGRAIARRPVGGIGVLGTCADMGLIIRLNARSMEFIDPSTGTLIGTRRGRTALPDYSRRSLYGLTDNGVVFAEEMTSTKRDEFATIKP